MINYIFLSDVLLLVTLVPSFFFLFLLYCILTWPLIIDTFDEFRFTGSAWASFLQGWGNLACMYWYVFHSYDRPDLPYEFFDCNSNKNV